MRVRLVSLTGLALTTLGLACTTSPEARFDLQTSVDKLVAHVGDSIKVTVTTRNLTSEDQQLLVGGCWAFYVLDSAGAIVGPASTSFCTDQLTMITVRSGGQYTETETWPGLVKPQESDAPTLAPPGVYSLRAIFRSGSGARVHSATVRFIT
jgi:hypothetical protein